MSVNRTGGGGREASRKRETPISKPCPLSPMAASPPRPAPTTLLPFTTDSLAIVVVIKVTLAVPLHERNGKSRSCQTSA